MRKRLERSDHYATPLLFETTRNESFTPARPELETQKKIITKIEMSWSQNVLGAQKVGGQVFQKVPWSNRTWDWLLGRIRKPHKGSLGLLSKKYQKLNYYWPILRQVIDPTSNSLRFGEFWAESKTWLETKGVIIESRFWSSWSNCWSPVWAKSVALDKNEFKIFCFLFCSTISGTMTRGSLKIFLRPMKDDNLFHLKSL